MPKGVCAISRAPPVPVPVPLSFGAICSGILSQRVRCLAWYSPPPQLEEFVPELNLRGCAILARFMVVPFGNELRETTSRVTVVCAVQNLATSRAHHLRRHVLSIDRPDHTTSCHSATLCITRADHADQESARPEIHTPRVEMLRVEMLSNVWRCV